MVLLIAMLHNGGGVNDVGDGNGNGNMVMVMLIVVVMILHDDGE